MFLITMHNFNIFKTKFTVGWLIKFPFHMSDVISKLLSEEIIWKNCHLLFITLNDEWNEKKKQNKFSMKRILAFKTNKSNR